VRRAALVLCSLAAVSTLAAGCGGSDSSSSAPTPTSAAAAPTPSPTNAAPSSSAAPAAALPAGCTAPSSAVDYTKGSATLDVTSGPDTGHYDLTLDTSPSSEYAPDDKEITGNWISADSKATLFLDIEGTDPCTPEAFTKIGTQGRSGPVFVDGGHTQCKVELPSLGAQGVQGSFTCKGLTGGGAGLTRDAKGTFELLP
jgi:hypothetical protein